MNAHEAIVLACLSLATALGLQTVYAPQLHWSAATRWTVPLCTGVDIGVDCVLPDKPAVD
jgi:hypothetical protein